LVARLVLFKFPEPCAPDKSRSGPASQVNRCMNIEIETWNREDKPEAADLKQRLQAEGYSVFQWTDEPGTRYGPHSHSEDQSHWIISGALELRVGHETYALRAGDRDFLPANTIHSAFVLGDEPLVYLIGAKI
jgi:quercetin dioxygenase-like cupin family protein